MTTVQKVIICGQLFQSAATIFGWKLCRKKGRIDCMQCNEMARAKIDIRQDLEQSARMNDWRGG